MEKCEKCTNDEDYWVDNKSECKDIGCKYSSGSGGGTKSSCKQFKCKEDKDYFKSHRTRKHKCEDNIYGDTLNGNFTPTLCKNGDDLNLKQPPPKW